MQLGIRIQWKHASLTAEHANMHTYINKTVITHMVIITVVNYKLQI
jgi:hypothetical protein